MNKINKMFVNAINKDKINKMNLDELNLINDLLDGKLSKEEKNKRFKKFRSTIKRGKGLKKITTKPLTRGKGLKNEF